MASSTQTEPDSPLADYLTQIASLDPKNRETRARAAKALRNKDTRALLERAIHYDLAGIAADAAAGSFAAGEQVRARFERVREQYRAALDFLGVGVSTSEFGPTQRAEALEADSEPESVVLLPGMRSGFSFTNATYKTNVQAFRDIATHLGDLPDDVSVRGVPGGEWVRKKALEAVKGKWFKTFGETARRGAERALAEFSAAFTPALEAPLTMKMGQAVKVFGASGDHDVQAVRDAGRWVVHTMDTHVPMEPDRLAQRLTEIADEHHTGPNDGSPEANAAAVLRAAADSAPELVQTQALGKAALAAAR